MIKKLVLVSALMVIACTPGNEEVPVEMLIDHENTLQLQKAENWLVRKTDNGFSVSTKDSRNSRIPEQVSVWLLPPSTNVQGEWPSRKTINEHEVFYRVDKNAGGSAGPGYQLSARYTSDKGTVLLSQYTQSESKPDFNLAWQVIEKLD
jgi:hypothetical protein